MMKVEDKQLLAKHGWVLECESPFEIRHSDGSFASGQAADIVLSAIQEGWFDDDQTTAEDYRQFCKRVFVEKIAGKCLALEDCGWMNEEDGEAIWGPFAEAIRKLKNNE